MERATERSINRIADRARARYRAWIDTARQQTANAANRVRDGKKPVKKLSKLGQKLTTVSHRATAQVLDQQTKMFENQLDAVAGRLRAAAEADTLVTLLRNQIALVPQDTSRFIADARGTLSIVTGAGSEMRSIIAGTVAEFRSPKRRSSAKKTAKKTATKTARKTAKKATSRKTGKKSASPARSKPAATSSKAA